MSHRLLAVVLLVGSTASGLHAQVITQSAAALPSTAHISPLEPLRPLTFDDTSLYPQLGPRDDQVNNGGVHFDFDIRYLNTYLYRGIDQSTLGHSPENGLQFDGKAEFDLGKLPHPFIGLFVNVFNADPISRFEEVRPYAGLEWTIKPLTLAGGLNAYIYPNRKLLDTDDVWASLTLDDSRLFHTQTPFLTPYIYAAFDVELYHGFYFEAGVKHDFVFEDYGATLSPFADVSYVLHQPYFSIPGQKVETGFQHYDVGLVGAYSLNNVMKFSKRHGEWSIVGYLYYTDGIANQLRADTRVWGGVGLRFSY